MAYDEKLERRVRSFFDAKGIKHETKRMMGGLCFLVNGKMCVGVQKARLMARIGPDAYDKALSYKGCRPMDFTGRPLRGFVFVSQKGFATEPELAFWLELALAYNPIARKSTAKKSAKKRGNK
jgi:TfoX/Sxy family transcriptional regulator of competence genes